MIENPERGGKVRKMFKILEDGTRINSLTGEVVFAAGFHKGQKVEVKRGGEVESGWEITNFDISTDAYKVLLERTDRGEREQILVPMGDLVEKE